MAEIKIPLNPPLLKGDLYGGKPLLKEKLTLSPLKKGTNSFPPLEKGD